MADRILGTAGHIDHGKTALVEALTGTDTDRLREEKERGITIELGFAELVTDEVRLGVVDVPGHEAFVRAMVAGATGMDVVLLVVAADEGIMPQTREHLAIVGLLGVPELVVAVTKCDLVQEEWLELVEAEIRETLEPTAYRDAPRILTSATSGEGLDELRAALAAAAKHVASDRATDLARLPLDRIFTIQGTGTVVTGTLWSGRLEAGERVRILPQGLDARIRSLQVHGRDAQEAVAGGRTAVALTGEGADRERTSRGSTLVTDPHWSESRMLTARVRLIPGTPWLLEHNQRVHLHLGTAEVLARVALLERTPLAAADEGWVQLRLEEPLVARAHDPLVLRSYSPVTTIGGGVVAESHPPKRTALEPAQRNALETMLDGGPEEAIAACLALAGWEGVRRDAMPVRTGLPPDVVRRVLERPGGGLVTPSRAFHTSVGEEAREAVLAAVDEAHRTDPLLATVPMAAARAGVPSWAPDELADAALETLLSDGLLEEEAGGVRRPGHEVRMTEEQEEMARRIGTIFEESGLAPPLLDEFPAALHGRDDFRALVRTLEKEGTVRPVAEGYYVASSALDAAEGRIRDRLEGRTGLGPADFREALPVTRKHLIPLLSYFDGRGVTIRSGDGDREVPAREV